MEFSGEIRPVGSLSWMKRREYLQHHRPWLNVVLWVVTVGSPILGLFVEGVIGVVIGLAISVVTQFLGPYAVTRVSDIERGSS